MMVHWENVQQTVCVECSSHMHHAPACWLSAPFVSLCWRISSNQHTTYPVTKSTLVTEIVGSGKKKLRKRSFFAGAWVVVRMSWKRAEKKSAIKFCRVRFSKWEVVSFESSVATHPLKQAQLPIPEWWQTQEFHASRARLVTTPVSQWNCTAQQWDKDESHNSTLTYPSLRPLSLQKNK